jgi:DNA-binding HxlR family transcriptional regulator
MMSDNCEHNPRVCAVFHSAIELIGRRWTGAIIKAMLGGPRRFCEFKEAIPELSDRLLTERLKELEENGLVVREVSAGRPVQVLYQLTAKGQDLQPILEAIGAWAGKWAGHTSQPETTSV